MIALLNAETQRFLFRRITRYFPLTLAGLIMVGVVIAYFVIQSQDGSVDFVEDLAFDATTEARLGSTTIMGPLGFLLPIMAYTLGSSYYGADQKSGMIELLLTWEPRRWRLLVSRLIGGSTVSFVIGAVLAVFSIAALWGLAAAAGTTEGMTGEMWGWIAMAVVRTAVVCSAFFVFGLALTVLLNNSVASIISFVIYAFVIENLVLLFLSWVGVWLPMANAGSFTSGLDVSKVSLQGETTPHHGYLLAGLVMVAYPLVSMVVAALVFQRRDVN